MYEYITGRLTFISPSYVVLDVNGIGYQIALGNPYRYSSKMEQSVTIYVQQIIREDAQLLYGFETLAEKELFLRLLSVSGIGPKSGLAIMANEDHQGLIQAIEAGDVTYLTKFPGVGKKTAQQMVLDLKGKLAELVDDPMSLFYEGNDDTALAEALEALQALGYSPKEIKKVEKVLEKETLPNTDDYLRAALKLMMKK
ncbi:Holliday junction branch migration protein RuvA [Enterococcus dongliensis]|uniref:Holliday junction branch migration complex subunit RuvA n=1 Tax=Enterococcus dongliensis TaxID=2559925 RepID=A0AAP5U0F0_9ENTE|nr:Holliday junction branch migration protein RuvA [Enterococcus dongliensis]MDT2596483.1 Holliday junction branch migration protein RuvA [Enterococcus dongliensis]MDT2604105.1 Holliday junction branch migration protein RuvA [Enterococcus dongliensis]MDT2634525.1 Holliday junction branch migration protein RuvA [Enterococcus dongliensis]MDT2636475.1 Holliday junction branch migration protein RuvA [Enterococcus dongliensis]MDT2640502.1 Holliday junction branch migration protein RuvA [Enterococcu